MLCPTVRNDTNRWMKTKVYLFFLLFGTSLQSLKEQRLSQIWNWRAEAEPKNFEEAGSKKWFEACRCFHILKEINICIHFDSDCTVQLQINNHNHKRPRDILSVGWSFFSLWQILNIAPSGFSNDCCLVCCECVCHCAPLSLCWGHSNYTGVNKLCALYEVCKGNFVTLYRLVYLCARLNVCSRGLEETTGHQNSIFISALRS